LNTRVEIRLQASETRFLYGRIQKMKNETTMKKIIKYV
jgi:hypothetical protein